MLTVQLSVKRFEAFNIFFIWNNNNYTPKQYLFLWIEHFERKISWDSITNVSKITSAVYWSNAFFFFFWYSGSPSFLSVQVNVIRQVQHISPANAIVFSQFSLFVIHCLLILILSLCKSLLNQLKKMYISIARWSPEYCLWRYCVFLLCSHWKELRGCH